jgi:hypothetical protein
MFLAISITNQKHTFGIHSVSYPPSFFSPAEAATTDEAADFNATATFSADFRRPLFCRHISHRTTSHYKHLFTTKKGRLNQIANPDKQPNSSHVQKQPIRV